MKQLLRDDENNGIPVYTTDESDADNTQFYTVTLDCFWCGFMFSMIMPTWRFVAVCPRCNTHNHLSDTEEELKKEQEERNWRSNNDLDDLTGV